MSAHDQDPAAAPQDGAVLYSERLRAPWWLWLVAIAFSVAVGIALSPTNGALMAGLAAVMFVILAILLVVSTPSIVVTPTTLSVGRATIERAFVGEVWGYVGDQAIYQRGRGLNGLAFMMLRGWIKPVVTAQIVDPRDETPYWIFSTNNPEAVTLALGGRMAPPSEDDLYGAPSGS